MAKTILEVLIYVGLVCSQISAKKITQAIHFGQMISPELFSMNYNQASKRKWRRFKSSFKVNERYNV
jgi:hypothetical protein